MITLTLFSSGKKYKYKNRTSALKELKGSGLKSYEYHLVDTSNNAIYKQGLWITPNEYKRLEDGANIKSIRVHRRISKRRLK